MLEYDIWNSAAWKELTGASREVLLFFRSKAHGRFEQAKTNNLNISYRDVSKDRKMAISTVRKSIVQLENIGFLDFVVQGGLKSGGYSKNAYKLSIRYLRFGLSDFKKGVLKEEHGIYDRGFGQHKKWGQWKQREAKLQKNTSEQNSMKNVNTIETNVIYGRVL